MPDYSKWDRLELSDDEDIEVGSDGIFAEQRVVA